MELFGTLDERRRVGEETNSPSNPPWLKYDSVAQGGGFVKYAIFSHDMSHLLPIKTLDGALVRTKPQSPIGWVVFD